jgi:hypothetical protein
MGLAEIRARNEKWRAEGTLPGAKGTGTTATKPAVAKPARVPLRLAPCVHEGAVLEFCKTCSGELRHVRDCALHERCTRGAVSDAVRACATCADYREG